MNKDEQLEQLKKEINDLKGYKEIHNNLVNDYRENEEFYKEIEDIEQQKIKKQIEQREQLENQKREIEELEKNKDNKILDIVKNLEEKFNNIQPIETQKEKYNKKLNDNIEEHFNNYVEHKKTFKNISHWSIKSYKSTFNYLKYFSNKDTIYNFNFFKQVQKNFQLLPKNFFKYKKYYEKEFNEVIKLKEIDNYDIFDNKTINNHMSNMKNFFDYLLYEEIIKENPLNNIKSLLEDKETKKEEYSEDDLKKSFREK